MFHYFCLADLTFGLENREQGVVRLHGSGARPTAGWLLVLLAGYWYRRLVAGPPREQANCWLLTDTTDQGGVMSCST